METPEEKIKAIAKKSSIYQEGSIVQIHTEVRSGSLVIGRVKPLPKEVNGLKVGLYDISGNLIARAKTLKGMIEHIESGDRAKRILAISYLQAFGKIPKQVIAQAMEKQMNNQEQDQGIDI